jgi:hypothetical protein
MSCGLTVTAITVVTFLLKKNPFLPDAMALISSAAYGIRQKTLPAQPQRPTKGDP